MKIDRSKALLFVSMLASAACTSANDKSSSSDNNSSTGGTSAGGTGGTGGTSANESGGSDGIGGSSAEGSGGMAGEGSTGEGLGGMAGASSTSEGTGAMAGAAAEGSGGAPACDDSVGASIDCDSIEPDASCLDLAPFHQGECTSAKTKLKPRVAEAVGQCILNQSAIDLCDALNTYDCVEQALDQACPDSSAAEACAIIIGACPSVTDAQCLQVLSGMTPNFREEAVACMQDTIFDCDFRFCAAEGL